jgi:hypothetical protein
MTSQSPRIYLYKITFEEVSYYYYGVHKEKNFDEYYMGSPVTHKWCWEFYTSKKQILEVFDYTDEGWLEALEVEKRLIKPFYQTDKWCLNESCGGRISLDILRENGKKVVEFQHKHKVGGIYLTKEERSKIGKKTGKKAAETNKKNNTGLYALTTEQRKENGRKYGPKAGFISGKKQYKNKTGMFSLTPEQMRENCRKGGKIGGKINGNRAKKLGLGMFALTEEEKQEARRKGRESINSQRWQCKETGYISTAAGVVSYQKGKKIDTSKNNRIRLS